MSVHYSLRKSTLVTAFAVLLFMYFGVSTAQLPLGETTTDGIFLLRDYQLLKAGPLDPQIQLEVVLTTESRVDRFDSDDSGSWRAMTAEVDHTGRNLYTIEGIGRTHKQFPTDTRVVRTELTTGIRTVILHRAGIFGFVFSPDQRRMIVGYHDGEFGVAARRSCIYEFVTGICREVSLQIGGSPGFWIDDLSYIVTAQRPLSLHLVNAESGEDTLLPFPAEWYLYSAVPIPDTRELLVSVTPQIVTEFAPSRFMTLNLDTLELRDHRYNALSFENYSGVGLWSFSPDGQFLLYGGGLRMALVEFQTGRLIHEFEALFGYGWIDNDTVIVQGVLNETTAGILRVDADTNTITQLVPPSESAGILIVPSP